jgi:hypothetical protein
MSDGVELAREICRSDPTRIVDTTGKRPEEE